MQSMEAQYELTDEQKQVIVDAFLAAAEAVREWWERIMEMVREAAKALSAFLESIRVRVQRYQWYLKLRKLYMPAWLAWWIAKLIPRRLLLMC